MIFKITKSKAADASHSNAIDKSATQSLIISNSSARPLNRPTVISMHKITHNPMPMQPKRVNS